MKKRRRRKYNIANLKYNKNKQVCLCATECVCGPSLVVGDASTQTDPHRTAKVMVDSATEITQHNNMLPKAGTWTRGDKVKEKCGNALSRLKKAIPFGFHWSSIMIAVMLRLLFNLIYQMNWNWTQGVHMTSKLLGVQKDTVFKLANNYLDNDVNIPAELVMQTRGRGSAKFINNGRDRYSALKEVCCVWLYFLVLQIYLFDLCTNQEHLKAIVEFVHERNVSQRGMCNVKAIQAHLDRKFGIYFEHHVVYYALRRRLKFKYRTPLCRRIVFSKERTELGIIFCRELDAALKLEQRGDAIIIYMDESYCHLQHLPGKMWFRDVDVGTERAERSRNKGSLAIMVHAMCKDGWVCERDENGAPPVVDEWHEGPAQTCEMVFRGKVGRGDYHKNFDGDMFMKWINERLVPTVQHKYPDKQVYVVMDNAPYHHGHPENSFFASGHNKEEIQAKLQELGCRQLTVAPYADLEDCPPVPTDTAAAHHYEGWVFCEKSTGECYMVDGSSDEGNGNVIVHTRLGRTRFGAVESAFEDDFRRLIHDDFMLVGHGEAAAMYVRSIMNARGKVPATKRQARRLQQACSRFLVRLRRTVWIYDVDTLAATYNGNGNKGTGGPPGDLLRQACDAYIIRHHPELRLTRVMLRFQELGWHIIWTVPYWAKSQPIELAWALIKNYVARMYHPGRTHKDLRRQILAGMYGGPGRNGAVHLGLTVELARSLISHTHKHINKFLLDTHAKHGMVGSVGFL